MPTERHMADKVPSSKNYWGLLWNLLNKKLANPTHCCYQKLSHNISPHTHLLILIQ